MHRKLVTLAVLAIAGSIGATRSAGQQTASENLTGTWSIHFQDDNGDSSSSPKLVIQQEGHKLTGVFGNQDWPVVGTLDGNTVVFSFTAYGHENGKAISDTVFYWGTLENGKMKGRMRNPKEAGNWVAVRN